MTENNEPVRPIIKRKKIIAAGGHHGGAWKVAYADFVTAMMAFFLLMWLIGATNEKQRKGVADYFNPTISPASMGSGSNVLSGDNFMPDNAAPHAATGMAGGAKPSDGVEISDEAFELIKDQVDKALAALTGESAAAERAFRHVISRVTDEGLVIELYDLADVPLFVGETATPQAVLTDVLTALSTVLGVSSSGIAVKGHLRSYPAGLIDNPTWPLSGARAETVRALLQKSGIPAQRLRRVEAHGDRQPVTVDPMRRRNNRIEIIMLRTSA